MKYMTGFGESIQLFVGRRRGKSGRERKEEKEQYRNFADIASLRQRSKGS